MGAGLLAGHLPHERAAAAGCKTTPKIATVALRRCTNAAQNSRWLQRPRILFVPSQMPGSPNNSIHVLLEPALLLELRHKCDGFIGRAGTELGDDVDQRALDVLGHPLGVAADIEMRAFGKPS